MSFKQKILVFLASLIIKGLRLTCRFEATFPDKKTEDEFYKAFSKAEGQMLLGFFHQDELCIMPFFSRMKNIAVLVSLSKDGQLMSGLAERLGMATVRGSSSKGAARGLLAAIKKVREGYNFAIAVDGPRGPIYEVKEGLPAISKKTEIPIIPARAYPDRAKVFEKSWNKAKLPMPFSKVELRFGAPAVYDAKELEHELKQL